MTLPNETPADKRELKFKLHTYPANRVASKLMRLLKNGRVYKVRDEWDTLTTAADRVYIITIETGDPYTTAAVKLEREIKSYLPDNFPENYTFEFPEFDQKPPFGFVNSFAVYGDYGVIMEGHHRIKEVKK